MLNQNVSIYMQTGNMEKAKIQLASILKKLKITGKLKTPEKILTEWKTKIEAAMEIYRELLKVEENLSGEMTNK